MVKRFEEIRDVSRRRLLSGMAAIPIAAAAQAQTPPPGVDPFQPPRPATLADLKGQVPQAELGRLKVSRMIFGGNLMGGWAHARDLSYVGRLASAYHTPEKVFETLAVAEKCGVNTLLTSPLLIPVITDYWKKAGGHIQFISDCGRGDLLEAVRKSIDAGANGCYIHGMVADRLAGERNFDLISRALELIRSNHMPAGIGAHKLESVETCVAQGLRPDFWMKTFHRTDYWSAKPQPQKDNIWCENPEEVAAFMRDLKQPWIAFKTLAAGAISPKDGFEFAFRNGADFICVGMFDWQVVDDCNTLLTVLRSVQERARPWRA